MSDLRPQPTAVTLGGKDYGLFFSMKAVDEIQDHFDRPITDLIDLLSDARNMYKNVTHVLTVLINANIDRLNEDGEKRPYIEEDYIYRHLTTGAFKDTRNAVFLAFSDALPERDGDTDADPRKSGRQKCSSSPACSTWARQFLGFLKKKSGT
jgi:hypothetical protein